MIFAVDFDGTCVEHRYPEIGKSIGAESVLKCLVDNGHKIILYTMRSHKPYEGRDLLQEAVDWFKDNGIELFGVNENPLQGSWTDSPKPYANYYIDDSALGCPLTIKSLGTRPYVDWEKLRDTFENAGIISIGCGKGKTVEK